MFTLNEICRTSLASFDSLPADASIRLHVMLCLYACSRATLYRHIQKGLVPKPHRLGLRTSVWQVGEVRASLQKLHNVASN